MYLDFILQLFFRYKIQIALRHLISRRPLDFAALFLPNSRMNTEHCKENCDVTY